MTTRALVVGSVAATGLFSSLAAWAQPGSKIARASNPTTGNAAVGGRLGLRARVGTGNPTGVSPATTPATTPPTQASSGGGETLTQPTSPPVTAPAYQYSPPVQYAPPVVVSGAS
jgi:hypothetical protein